MGGSGGPSREAVSDPAWWHLASTRRIGDRRSVRLSDSGAVCECARAMGAPIKALARLCKLTLNILS